MEKRPGSTEKSADELIDAAALSAWMDTKGLGEGPLEHLTEITGGTQNVMVRFERSGRRYVLRCPPPHKRAASDKVICREIQLLGALSRTPVRHPRLIAGCEDPEVLGGSFYLMEWVEGFNAGEGLPALHASEPKMRHAMGLSVVDAIAVLGRVDSQEVGLEGFGNPEGFLQRQRERWQAELERHLNYEGYDKIELPDVASIGRWLDGRVPQEWQPGVIHGDYHLGNVMFSRESPDVVAIVDWEMSTIGDPLLDLGWLLATYPEDGHTPVMPEVDWTGYPEKSELIERYALNSTRDLSRMDWYEVLACYKLGIILEGTHARARAGKAPKETGAFLHEIAVDLIEHAHEVMG